MQCAFMSACLRWFKTQEKRLGYRPSPPLMPTCCPTGAAAVWPRRYDHLNRSFRSVQVIQFLYYSFLEGDLFYSQMFRIQYKGSDSVCSGSWWTNANPHMLHGSYAVVMDQKSQHSCTGKTSALNFSLFKAVRDRKIFQDGRSYQNSCSVTVLKRSLVSPDTFSP